MATTYPQHDQLDEQSNDSKIFALCIVLVFHGFALFFLYYNGFTVDSSLAPEQGIEIVFEQEVDREAGFPAPKNTKVVDNPPIINTPGDMAPVNAVVAKSNESTAASHQPDASPSELTDKGDIDKTPVVKPKEINKKGLFQSTAEGTEEADNPTNIRDKNIYSGVGRSDQVTRSSDTPTGPEHRQAVTANLSGRSVVGSLPLPQYKSQGQGRVMVEIIVDRNGKVTKATAVGKGSTIQDAKLWREAEKAALKAQFNVKTDASLFQTGSIAYVFTLN